MSLILRYPLHMVWAVTNLCNAHCVHCSSSAGCRLPGELDTKEALGLIDQLAELGVVDLALSGGEALLRPDIDELISHAVKRNMQVGLGTNGWWIQKERAHELKRLGLHRVQISLDGLGPVHDQVRGLPGLFERATAAMHACREAGLQTHVCFTPHRDNVQDLEHVIQFAYEQGIHLFNLSQFVPVGRGSQAMDLSAEKWKEIARHWANKRREYAGRMKFTSHLAQMALVDASLAKQEAFRGCQAGTGQGYIAPDGTVTPCVMLPVGIGNVKDKPFREIWDESFVISDLRDRSNLGGKCGSCVIRERCGGCRGVAYGYYQTHMAEDPHCWLPPEAAQAKEQIDSGLLTT